ncbi:hypothetical protein [Rhizobium sp. OAE497]|uniref:hypothetical protein n=1 Tax=Rhizobium sp. OAE497 TaxID=2663796 RepID=UPI0018F2D440
MDRPELETEKFYWARRRGSSRTEIVMVSSLFGGEREFWTVAVMGSESHAMLDNFEFFSAVDCPAGLHYSPSLQDLDDRH